MHLRPSLPLISLFALLALQVQANPTKRGFCVGSPSAIFKFSNFWFRKSVFSSPDVSPSCNVTFDFADTYHGFSTKCNARYQNCGGIKNLAEPESNSGTFDGSKLFDCEDGEATQFRFWENGRLDLVHRWTCDTPGGFAPR